MLNALNEGNQFGGADLAILLTKSIYITDERHISEGKGFCEIFQECLKATEAMGLEISDYATRRETTAQGHEGCPDFSGHVSIIVENADVINLTFELKPAGDTFKRRQ